MSHHPIVHIELPAKDRKAAGAFYADLFGWQIQHMPDEMNYSLFTAEGGPGGGFTPVDGEFGESDKVLIYVQTDDIETSLAKAEALGGTRLVPKTEIPQMGWFAIFRDPTGNRVGLFAGMPQEQAAD